MRHRPKRGPRERTILSASATPVAVNPFGSVQPATSYAYDGDGLRTAKTTPTATTGFTWEVAEGLPLLLTEGTTSYVYGPVGLPLERVDPADNVVYYAHDQLGSTRLLTDQAGNVAVTAIYDAYGQPQRLHGLGHPALRLRRRVH